MAAGAQDVTVRAENGELFLSEDDVRVGAGKERLQTAVTVLA
jgi:hypothetical protein